jgi:glucose/arabinose dehydrogenase
MRMRVMERITPGTRVAGPEVIQLPAGYEIEPVAEALNYPTSVSWDVDGYLLIAESQFPYGKSAPTEARILRMGQDGGLEPLASGFDLINDITVYGGLLYVSHRGRISVVEDGRIRDLVTGLPSWGMHQNNALVFDRSGRMYFSQGTTTNAGVIDQLSARLLRMTEHLEQHDIPGATVILTGINYESADPLTEEVTETGAFVPWGTMTPAGHRVEGAAPGQAAAGAIMRANADGSDLRVYAWGLRNPFGLAMSADGRLYATNNGANLNPPRPIANDSDTLWRIEEGTWYGWPDFYGGSPVTDPTFAPEGQPPHEFLIANHDELLKGRAGPPEPIVKLGMNVSPDKFDFCLHPEFGYENQAFVAEFGPMLAVLAGAPPDLPAGRKVVRVDLAQRTVTDFATNREGSYPSRNGNRGGLERPVEAKFGPDGNLYIVDYGVMQWEGDMWQATSGTGIVWRVTHSG